MPASRTVTSVETFSGQYVDLLHPHADTIKLVDIATHLANTCRFAGGVSRYYSVAEHAVRVSRMVPTDLALEALHHDSHEFVLGDIPAPLKAALRHLGDGSGLAMMADRLDRAICTALRVNFAELHCSEIRTADAEALYHEAAALKWSHGVGEHWDNDRAYEPWIIGFGMSPREATIAFYERHMELTS